LWLPLAHVVASPPWAGTRPAPTGFVASPPRAGTRPAPTGFVASSPRARTPPSHTRPGCRGNPCGCPWHLWLHPRPGQAQGLPLQESLHPHHGQAQGLPLQDWLYRRHTLTQPLEPTSGCRGNPCGCPWPLWLHPRPGQAQGLPLQVHTLTALGRHRPTPTDLASAHSRAVMFHAGTGPARSRFSGSPDPETIAADCR
jgi:hypothetical protein